MEDTELIDRIAELALGIKKELEQLEKKLERPLGPQVLYNKTQSARMLGISPSMVQQLIRQGRIRTRQWGKKHLVSHEELLRVSKQDFMEVFPPKGSAA